MPNISTSIFYNYSFVSPNPFDKLNNLGKTINNNNDVHAPSKSLLPPTSIERINTTTPTKQNHTMAMWHLPEDSNMEAKCTLLTDSCDTW